jgi:hypothetical protein
MTLAPYSVTSPIEGGGKEQAMIVVFLTFWFLVIVIL